MSTEELLARLARLDERDRAWLLGELPAAMRRELAELLVVDDVVTTAPPAATPAGWEAMEAERVAGVLEQEPAWLVSAATRQAPTEWRGRLLQCWSSRRRLDVENADRLGRPLGARATNLILQGCRARLESGQPAAAGRAKSGFAALVEQMRSRFA